MPKPTMLLAAMLSLLSWNPARAQEAPKIRDAGRLKLHKRVQRELGPGGADQFAFHVKAGQFFHVMAEEIGVDVVLTLIDPGGRELFSADASTGGFGFEHASAVAKQAGTYNLKVQSKPGSRLQGKCVVELRTLGTPSEIDLQRLQAEELLRSAVADNRTATKQSRLRAIEELTKSVLLWKALHDEYEEGLGVTYLGVIHYSLGESETALGCFQQALPLRRAAGDRAGEATVLRGTGLAYSALGEKQKALGYYQEALRLERALGDLTGEAMTLNNIGLAYSGLGEKQKALDYYKQSLPGSRSLGNQVAEAMTLNNIGVIYRQLGEKQKALEYYQQALPIKRAIDDRAGEANTLANIGIVYQDLGKKEDALKYFEQALAIFRAVGNRVGEAGTLSNIGAVYNELGEQQKALDYYQQSLQGKRSVGDRTGEGKTLMNIGNVYYDLGDLQNALEYYHQALTVSGAVGDRANVATTLGNIGNVYRDLGNQQQALDYYQQALPEERAVGDRSGEAKTLNNLMGLFQKAQPDLAILFGKQAVNVLQGIRRDNRGLDEELRRSYEKLIESNYRSLADLMIERDRFGEAEEVLNLLKDQEVASFIRRDSITDQLRPATLLDFERKALERYDHVVNQIVVLGQQKSALISKSDRTPLTAVELDKSNSIDHDLDAANTVLHRYFEEQQKAFPADSSLAKRIEEFKEAEGLQDVLQKLGPGVVAIYTLVTPDKYVAMLVTSGSRKAYTTKIGEVELNRKIFEFRQKLQDPGSDPVPLAQELYRTVFPEGLRRDLDALQARTIMWSIDNTLRYVPMAALHDGKDYLVKSFRNSLITPASLANLAENPSPLWEGVGFGVSNGSPPLPSVPDELKGIFQENPDSKAPVPGSVRLNSEFTRATFEQDLRRQRNRVVHIATHFDSRPGVAADSQLLLGDGELSLAEIEAKTRLFNGVELLTLSACNTAFMNRNEDGREVDSFGTIAQRLGAKAVIASLWSVNDSSTARLMQEMYQMRQRDGMPKSEALRLAQEAMLDGKLGPAGAAQPDRGVKLPPPPRAAATGATGWSHPFYWAPFILIGNWK